MESPIPKNLKYLLTEAEENKREIFKTCIEEKDLNKAMTTMNMMTLGGDEDTERYSFAD